MLIRSALNPRASRGAAARLGACGLVAAGATALALALPAMAAATPTVSLKAKIVPIPGFPHTGNILGAGADLEVEIGIEGNEYAGGPPPITQIKGFYPKGTKINTKGFTTCSADGARTEGHRGLPEEVRRRTRGRDEGFVSLGGERVPETVQVSPFLATGGGLDFWIEGNSPVKIEKLAKGSWSFPASGPVITVEVPLIETLPGAPDASATLIKIKFGGAHEEGQEDHLLRHRAQELPEGRFPREDRSELPRRAATVTAETKVPCPPKKK